MPPHRYTQQRRTQRQARADERASHLAAFLGRSLRNARRALSATQTAAAEVAGVSQSCWSDLERGRGANVSLTVWMRAGDGVGADLHAYFEGVSGAEAPRDAVHLRHQELIARYARPGGWQVAPEQGLGAAGVADVILRRETETALIEVWDWFADVGEAFRSWDRKLERVSATEEGAVSGCWVVRATVRNRELVAMHRTLFEARFGGSGAGWLKALREDDSPMPTDPALIWVSVDGSRLFASRAARGPR